MNGCEGKGYRSKKGEEEHSNMNNSIMPTLLKQIVMTDTLWLLSSQWSRLLVLYWAVIPLYVSAKAPYLLP